MTAAEALEFAARTLEQTGESLGNAVLLLRQLASEHEPKRVVNVPIRRRR